MKVKSLCNPNHLKGLFFESLAVVFLLLKGYHIVAHNLRGRQAQVDILAIKNKILVVVEVKFRNKKDAAHTAIHPVQMNRLMNQANQLKNRYKCEGIRIDALFFYPLWPFVEHVQNIKDAQ
tara:strand:- start:385 stop:747 length:363 start_codon:yes stop_codon:yes gene_type:complete